MEASRKGADPTPAARDRDALLERVEALEAENSRLRDELRESDAADRELLEKMMEIQTVGIIFFDPAGDIVEANDAFLEMGGYSREDLEARELRWDRLTPPEHMDASRRAIDQLLTAGSTQPYEKEYYTKDGGTFWGLFAAKGLSSDRGVEFILDITEEKEAQAERDRLHEEAKRARAEAEEANRAKSEFLAAMSHELRTPLNAIGGYVQLLEMGVHGEVNEKQEAAYARIQDNTRHLLLLIEDVLSYAKLEAGRVSFDLEPVNAAKVLDSVGSLVAPLADDRGVAYTARECDPDLTAWADRERLRQILLNLVTNGIKYTDSGGWVVLSCTPDGEDVVFTVEDNGPGIPPAKQEQIFEAFTQVERRAEDSREGVGLGLAISRDLARAMDGRLTVDSEVGVGTTFSLRLPRRGSGGSASSAD